MKNGKIFKGCTMLLALMLLLWTVGCCFAEGEAAPGPEIECQMYESDTAEDEGSVISIEEYKKTEIDGKEFYQLKLYRQKYYLLKIKTNSSKNLTITMNNKEMEDQEENKDIFEKTVDEEGNQEIKLKVQHSEENKAGFWIYIDTQDETPVTIRFMIQWQDWEGSVQSTGQKTETTTGDSGEGTTESGTGDAPSTDVPDETSGVAAPVLPVETTPVDNTEPAGPAEETFPAPTINLSGDKTLKRVSEDAMEWTISEDFETLLLTVEHITDDKGPIIVTCGDEKAGEETSTETTEEETKTAAQKKGKKAEVKEKEPIVIDLKDYVRNKVADQKDFHFVVDWTATTDESQKQNNQKAGDASAEIGTVNEDKTEFTLHVISKATVSILQESTEDKQDNDNEDNNKNTIVEILADNGKDDLKVTVSVNRDFGTVTILQALESGEETVLASAEVADQAERPIMKKAVEASADLGALVINENVTDESAEQDEGLKNQFQEVVGKAQEANEQTDGAAAEEQNAAAETTEPAAEPTAEPAEETPAVQEPEATAPAEPVSYEKNVTVEIVIEKGKISGDDAKLIARYENADGEEAKSAETIVYTRRWQEISITAPTETQYLYFDRDRNLNTDKTVQITVAGEAGKAIEVTLLGGKTVIDTLGKNGIYDLTYAETQETKSIVFAYKDRPEQKTEIAILTDGEPGEKALVFKVCSPTIAGPIYDNTHPIVRIDGAVPGSRLILAAAEPEEQKTDSGAIRPAVRSGGELMTMQMAVPEDMDAVVQTAGEAPAAAESSAPEAETDENGNYILTADGNGRAEFTREEPFAAGTILTISEEGGAILAQATVEADTLADILPETEPEQTRFVINGKNAEQPFSIHGTAKANRAMLAAFANRTQAFASDGEGKWEVSFPLVPGEDGNYEVTFQYAGRGTDYQKYVNVLIDTACSFTSEDGRKGVISVEEGAEEVKFFTDEPDGFEEIRIVYQQAGKDPVELGTSEPKKPDEHGFITYSLPVPIQKKDSLTVFLKDHAGNDTGEEGVAVEIGTVSFTYSLEDTNGEKPAATQGLYLTENRGYQIGISGAPGTEVEIAVEKKDGTDRKTLATEKEGETFTLSAAALQEAYGEELPKNQEFNLILHRADIESEESDQIFPFTYDTECTLTVNQEEGPKPAAPAFGEKTVTISGTADPDAVVEVAMIRKNGESASKQQQVDEKGQFSIETTLKPDSDTIKVTAKDTAGNSTEHEIKVQPSKAVPIILLGVGAILMAISLFMFLGTQKKIRQLEEINRAKTATVQEKKKR